MAVSTRSEFVDFIIPLHDRLKLYDRTKPPTDQAKNDATDAARAIPQGFLDAMIVRESVFVQEQHVPLENELDDDDARSFHWVAYASVPAKSSGPADADADADATPGRRPSTSTKIPIGTIRLVLPPHGPHPTPGSHHPIDAPDPASRKDGAAGPDAREPYVKLGRLAVLPEFRRTGISRLLIDTALALAREHPHEMLPPADPTAVEARRQGLDPPGAGLEWRGWVLVHAQVGVQRLWRRAGFETDEGMGVWDEEGIDHVGMWRRLDVTQARRASRTWKATTG